MNDCDLLLILANKDRLIEKLHAIIKEQEILINILKTQVAVDTFKEEKGPSENQIKLNI